MGSSKWRMFTNAGLDSSDPAIAMSLWNCDKTAFSTSASAAKFLVRGTKAVYKIGGGFGCECIIVHCAGSGYHSSFIQGKNLYKGGWRVAQLVNLSELPLPCLTLSPKHYSLLHPMQASIYSSSCGALTKFLHSVLDALLSFAHGLAWEWLHVLCLQLLQRQTRVQVDQNGPLPYQAADSMSSSELSSSWN